VLLQRVARASVSVGGQVVGSIGQGLLLLVGVGVEDTQEDVSYLADKLLNLRVFEDQDGKFDRSALEVGAELLVVSQFTLYADVRKGRRPSFTEAAPPRLAQALVESLVHQLQRSGLKVAMGEFGQHMLVELQNDGPVTILLDSKELRSRPRRG
jgi:D-tyrosyl-tRNA(Tyr) deacylase